MSITNISASKSVAENIVLSGGDLTSKGYANLDDDLILNKDNAPKLFDKYAIKTGSFQEVFISSYDDIKRISNEIFIRGNSGSLSFSKEFDFSDEILLNFNHSEFGYINIYEFRGVVNNNLVFFGEFDKKLTLIKFNENLELSLLVSDVYIRQVDLSNIITTSDPVYSYLYKDKIYLGETFDNIKIIKTDIDFEDLTKITSFNNTLFNSSNTNLESQVYLSKNGIVMMKGQFFNIENGIEIDSGLNYSSLIDNTFEYFHKNGKDYFSFKGSSTDLIGLVSFDKDLNLEIINLTDFFGISSQVYLISEINNKSCIYSDDLLNTYPTLYNKIINDGVVDEVGERYSTYYNILRSSVCDLFDDGGLLSLSFDNNTNIFTKYIDTTIDTFKILATPSPSADKKYWIKIE